MALYLLNNKKMDVVVVIKSIIAAVAGWIGSVVFYFLPIEGLITAVTIAFVLSFSFGIIASLWVQGESISMHKIRIALSEIASYCLLLASLFVIGESMSSRDFVYNILSIITWGLIYFYLINLMKNLSRLIPSSKGLRYIHFVLSLEFMKRAPHIEEFEKQETENQK